VLLHYSPEENGLYSQAARNNTVVRTQKNIEDYQIGDTGDDYIVYYVIEGM
jgi:hypothetical protein